MVAYLIDEYGADSFRGLVRELALGGPFEEALMDTYGFDVDQLEARWAGDPGSRAPEPAQRAAGGNIWASSSALVLGVLVVVVALLVTVRYVLGRLRRAQDPGEGLQPWEDPDLWDGDEETPR